VTAAEHADAGLLAAVSAFRLAHVFIKRNHPSRARDLVAGAANAVQRSAVDDAPQRLSVLGALHLADALAAAFDFDRAAASRSLAAASHIAERIGAERNDHWTAFGLPMCASMRYPQPWHSVTLIRRFRQVSRWIYSSFLLASAAVAPR
jgi:hypothetical protein